MMPDKNNDPHNLSRFVEAQSQSYDRALAEIRRGHKTSHWIWYIFPQIQGLGFSANSERYAIKSLAEARAYLAHPVLGPRLIACFEALLSHKHKSADAIFGYPDTVKVRSSATLFALVSPPGSVFHQVLDRYFESQPDQATLERISHDR
jgi:uncharacterized protein (DUF1810 family)